MSTFHVFAAHRDTGADVTLLVDADSSSAAAQHANTQGFLVRTVEEVTPPVAPSPAIDFDDDDTRAAIRSLARSIIHDDRFSKRLRRIIIRGVAEGMIVFILVLFVLVPLATLLFVLVTGITVQSIMGR